MKIPSKIALLAIPLLALSSLGADAHHFWYETEGDGLSFRYGDMDFNMLEVSPGGLDKIAKLQTKWLSDSGERQVELVKGPDGLDLPAGFVPGPRDTLVSVDLEYPMFNTRRDGKSLRTYWVPATRWVGSLEARDPELMLDIVPTGKKNGAQFEFQVTYLGEPLAGESMRVMVPSGWVKTIVSDGEGKFETDLPWSGNYAIQLYFIDEVEGVRRIAGMADEAYQLEGYNTTLSFYVSGGVEPFPVTKQTLPASVLRDMGVEPPKHR